MGRGVEILPHASGPSEYENSLHESRRAEHRIRASWLARGAFGNLDCRYVHSWRWFSAKTVNRSSSNRRSNVTGAGNVSYSGSKMAICAQWGQISLHTEICSEGLFQKYLNQSWDYSHAVPRATHPAKKKGRINQRWRTLSRIHWRKPHFSMGPPNFLKCSLINFGRVWLTLMKWCVLHLWHQSVLKFSEK